MSAVIVTSCVIRTSKGETLNSTSSFDALEVFSGIEVILTPSPTVSFAVEGNERAKSKLEMRVDNGTLRIEADGLRSGDWLKIRLSAPVPEHTPVSYKREHGSRFGEHYTDLSCLLG